jgi:hypothetical protein
MSINSLVEVERSLAEQHCNDVLANAGLHPQWRPYDLTLDLIHLGQEVRDFIDSEVSIDEEKSRTILELGQVVTSNATQYFRGPWQDDTVEPAFRAHTAIKRGIGNCIAASEIVNGILSELGLVDSAVTIWGGKHALNGLVVDGKLFEMDGYLDEVDFVQEQHAGVNKAARAVVQKERASLMYEFPTRIKTKPIDRLHTWKLRENKNPTLMLPAASAVLIFCGMASAQSDNPKYHNAKEVLIPFTPVTVK